jgi:hypothetical protein
MTFAGVFAMTNVIAYSGTDGLLGATGTRYRWPSKTVIRNVLAGIASDEMDRIVGEWLFSRLC